MVCEAEEAIRKLSAAAVGCGIQGTLSLVLPHCLAGLLLNGVEGMYRYKELKRVKDVAGGKRELLRKLSFRNMVAQMVAGASIKGTSTVLFMGTEFDTWGQAMGLTTVELSDLASAVPEEPSVGPFNGPVSILPNEIKEAMGEIPGTDWTWEMDKPTIEIAAVGAAAGVSEQAAAIVVEIPLHRAAGKATASRP